MRWTTCDFYPSQACLSLFSYPSKCCSGHNTPLAPWNAEGNALRILAIKWRMWRRQQRWTRSVLAVQWTQTRTMTTEDTAIPLWRRLFTNPHTVIIVQICCGDWSDKGLSAKVNFHVHFSSIEIRSCWY